MSIRWNWKSATALVKLVDNHQGRRLARAHQPHSAANRARSGDRRPARPHSRQTFNWEPTTMPSRFEDIRWRAGKTYPEQFLAMDNGATLRPPCPGGTLTKGAGLRPAGVLDHRAAALAGGDDELHTVVEATAVLATHLTEIIKSHAHELLSRQDVKNLIDNLKAPRAGVDRGSHSDAGEARRAAEGHAESICASACRCAIWRRSSKRSATLPRGPRTWMSSANTSATPWPAPICKQYVDDRDRLWVVTLDPALEETDQWASGAQRARNHQYHSAAKPRSRSHSILQPRHLS